MLLGGIAGGAFIEVFRDFTLVDAADVTARRISRLHLSLDVVLADCTSTRARGFGMTAAIHSTPDYGATQIWASTLRRSGFGGIRYYCGHDPSQRQIGIAIFGDAGEAVLPVVDTSRLGDDVIRTVERRFGIRVVPAP